MLPRRLLAGAARQLSAPDDRAHRAALEVLAYRSRLSRPTRSITATEAFGNVPVAIE
jgi:hypothetical protein